MTSDSYYPAECSLFEYEVGEGDEGDPIESDRTPLLAGSANMAAVKDKYSISYLIFYLLGLGSLLPWNFFITASDYWMYKLRDVNATVPEGITVVPILYPNVSTASPEDNSTSTTPSAGPVTTLQSLFMNSLAICAMLPNVIFQFLNTLLQKRIPQNVRILTTLTLMILLFIFTEILVKVDTSTWQNAFFTITLLSVIIVNSCSAIFQSSVFGVAARFPQKYSGAVMAGQGMGGVFAALAMIIALAFSSNPTDSAFIFFLVAIVILLLTVLCYIVLTKLEFYKFFTSVQGNEGDIDEKDLALQPSERNIPEEKHLLTPAGINNGDGWEKNDEEGRNGQKYSHASSSSEDVKIIAPEASLWSISKQIWLHMFCVVYTFSITLTCFPAVTAKIKSSSSGSQWSDVYFTPVCCFLLYNLGDWLGRTSASYIHIPSAESKVALTTCVLLRTVFPFLFALCNYKPRHNLPVVFHQDVWFIIFMVLFALSNGHLSTLCMQYGPKQVEPQNAPTAGSMMAFMISVGLLTGAGMSFVVCSLI